MYASPLYKYIAACEQSYGDRGDINNTCGQQNNKMVISVAIADPCL